jgi:arabinofuranan 3-O-arabinosyltransferase
VATPGEELDKLLYEVAPAQQHRITATADSTAALGTGLSARNLTDGDLTTGWMAGDRPTIHLTWTGKQAVGEVVLAPAGGLSTRPTEVDITSPDGATIAGVDENGVTRFDPITTDSLTITITKTAPLTLHNPIADENLQLPVGLTEAYIPALDQYRTPQPDPSRTFTLPCGKGPVVAVDGELYGTSVTGTVRDLTERRSMEVTLCQQGKTDGALELTSGTHRVEAGDAGPLTLTDVTLTRGTVTEPTARTRELTVQDWLGDRREVTVGAGAASYFTTYENYNDGWKATLNGKELTPVRLDGWQQGWRVPAGAGGTIKLSYEPATTYEAGLIGSGVALAALLALVIWRRDEPNPDEFQPPPPLPGLWLGTVALTLVGSGDRGLVRATGPGPGVARLPPPRIAGPHRVRGTGRGGHRSGDGGGRPGRRWRGSVQPRGPTPRPDRLVRGLGERTGVVRSGTAAPPLPQRERGTSALGEKDPSGVKPNDLSTGQRKRPFRGAGP